MRRNCLYWCRGYLWMGKSGSIWQNLRFSKKKATCMKNANRDSEIRSCFAMKRRKTVRPAICYSYCYPRYSSGSHVAVDKRGPRFLDCFVYACLRTFLFSLVRWFVRLFLCYRWLRVCCQACFFPHHLESESRLITGVCLDYWAELLAPHHVRRYSCCAFRS